MLSKRDLLPGRGGRSGGRRVAASGSATGCSASSRSPRRPATGLEELRRRDPRRAAARRRRGRRRRRRREPAEFEAEHRVYRPAGEGGYSVEREDDGAFRVLGRGVELLFERHDLATRRRSPTSSSACTEIGVVAALRAAGFEPGDDVRIGEHEFELHPLSTRLRGCVREDRS